MLGRFELLFGILGAWIASIIVLILFKKKHRDSLPKGSIVVKEQNVIKDSTAPGTKLSQFAIAAGFGVASLVSFIVVFLCIFNLWNSVPSSIALNFPSWINIIGLIWFWIHTTWGTLTIAYNVNYTPLYKPINEDYVLATGGPYKLVRHPMYVSKGIAPIVFFLLTGIWITLFGLISWIFLVPQVKAEEKLMEEKFGIIYSEYIEKTGRFFPKIRKKE